METYTTARVDEERQPYNLADYDRMYRESEAIDMEHFAEERSNVLLFAGEHYNRKRINLYRKLRDFTEVSAEQRLRITKNHIQNICKIYSNEVLSASPDVGFRPHNEKETQDQKDAELFKKFWTDSKKKYSLDERKDDWCDAMTHIGEVAALIQFDPFSELSGKRFNIEDIFGFNLMRPVECKDIRYAAWLCIRSMMSIDDARALCQGDPEKLRFVGASMDETMKVFDSMKSSYRSSENELMLRRYFFRPCAKYPKGWYAYVVKGGVLFHGELPYGIFPIVLTVADRAPTYARGISPIRTMRPYQVEINRCASKIAETHTTLGDDKVILSNGAKFSPTAAYPGIRAFGATGGAVPVVVAGRSGEQYVPHMEATIRELYQVMNVAEHMAAADPLAQGQLDPYALIFRSAKQKKKFQRYIKRFNLFLIDVFKTMFELAKHSLSDEEWIEIVGRDEMDNIVELRSRHDYRADVIIEESNEDIETKMGRQFMINHALQYVGPQLSQNNIGKLLRHSELGSYDGLFGDMCQSYDNLENNIIALDRGDQPPVHPRDDHVYMSAGLNARTQREDFKHLPPDVQQNYQLKITIHDKFEAWVQEQQQRAKDGYIPTGGYLVVCDMYVPKADNPEETQRARIPYESLQWLFQRLGQQNMGLKEIEQMSASQSLGVIEEMNRMHPNNPMQGGTRQSPPGTQPPRRIVA